MAMQRMKLSQLRYDVPEELVAQYPLDNRDDSRLMIIHRDTGKFEHRMFKDVVDIFDEGDVFVANNTKVFPAKMYGNKEKPARSSRSSCFVNSTARVCFGMFWWTPQEKFGLATSFTLGKTTSSSPR